MSRHAESGLRPGRILISEEELRSRVTDLGQLIARDYEKLNPILVGVLQGGLTPRQAVEHLMGREARSEH